jgi:hypothetical protein
MLHMKPMPPPSRDASPRAGNPHYRRLFAVLAAACAPALLSGCEMSRTAERRLDKRVQGMVRPIEVWGAREAKRPDNLAAGANWIAMDLERSAGRLERNLQWFGEWQRRDFERWQARQPVYLKKTGSILWGRPENIENTAIKLFF